jgi:hypothetical protein
MLASTLAGFIWYQFGAGITFSLSALMVLAVAICISIIRTKLTSN